MSKTDKLKIKLIKQENIYLSKKKKEYENKSIIKLYDIYDKLNNNLMNYNHRSYNINDMVEGGIVDNSKEGIELQLKVIKEIIDNRDINETERKFNSYPSYNNINFSNDISNKYEFNVFNTELKNNCNEELFELAPHQIFLKNFISKSTPYKSLLIYHGTGVCKTCTGISIAENFRDIYSNNNKKIIILASKNIVENWKNNILDPSKGDNQCTGNTYLNLINSKSQLNKKPVTKNMINKTINNYYEFYGYQKFANIIKSKMNDYSKTEVGEKAEQLRLKAIKDYCSNRVIIIDEVHNIRNPERSIEHNVKDIVSIINKVVTVSENLRLIMLTATPMYNNVNEIIWLLNIMLSNDKRPTINENNIFKDNKLTKNGKKILIQKLRGYVSYLRGENPYNFPIRFYPDINDDTNIIVSPNYPKKDIFNNLISNPIIFLKLFGCKFTGLQKLIYNKVVKKLNTTTNTKLSITNEIELMQLSNIVFPNNNFKNINKLYSEEGLKSCFLIKNNRFSYKPEVFDKYGPFLSEKTLNKYSSKIYELIQKIKKSKGVVYIYTQYKWSGIYPILLALEQNGYGKYNSDSILNTDTKSEPISYNGETYSKFNKRIKKNLWKEEYNEEYKKKFWVHKETREISWTNPNIFKQGKYIVVSGGQDNLSNNNKEEIKKFVSNDNKSGENIKIIIGTIVSSEGIDLKYIREIHIIDPWHHLNRIEQTIGRGIRFCSHNDLDISLRNVTIYQYVGYNDLITESSDIYIYRNAEYKSINIGKIEKLLKENSIDCPLFRDINIIRDKNIKPITFETSQGKIIEYKPIDKPFSKSCSYSKQCYYKCNTNKDKNINWDTINKESINNLLINLNKYIQELFMIKDNFQLKEIIDYINQYLNVDKTLIYFSINKFIKDQIIIKNKNNNSGYIIFKSNNYIFQPIKHTDESISMYTRSNILDSTSTHINIDYKKIEPNISLVKPNISTENSYDNLLSIIASIKSNDLIKSYKWIINDIDLLLPYSFDKLPINDKFSLLEMILNKPIDIIKKSKFINIIYNYCRRNFIYLKNKRYIIDNIKLKDFPVGVFFVDNKKPVFKLISNGRLIEASDSIIESIYTFIEMYKGSTIFKNRYINLPKIWGYGFKQYNKSIENNVLKIVTPLNKQRKYEGIICQSSSQEAEKSIIIDYIKDYFNDYYSDTLLRGGYINSKSNICDLLEFILRKNTTQETTYYFSYDNIVIKYI